MTSYILQKDLPSIKAGKRFSWDNKFKVYCAKTNTGAYIPKHTFTKEEVENNTEWFLPVVEEKIKLPIIFLNAENSKTKINIGGVAQHSIYNLVRRIDGYSFDDCKIVMNLSSQKDCNQVIEFLTVLSKCLPK